MSYFNSITQNVVADPNNTSETNLTSANGYAFTGTASSTLGVIGLQWSLKTDQNATIYIDQSPNGTDWDISYVYYYKTGKGGEGETVQATQSYWRIRVVLDVEIDTTYFRLQGVLCPIAMPLPSSLSSDARLKTQSTISGKENTNRHAWISPAQTLGTYTNVRLVGTNFDGTVKDTNFWTETSTNGGSVTQDGKILLSTNTTANGTAKYQSVRRARFVVGSPLVFQSLTAFISSADADNIRRMGAYDSSDGFYFQLDGSTFSVGSRNYGIDTLISDGSFNGNKGTTFTPEYGETHYKLSIEWTPNGTFYFIDNELLHQSIGGHLSNFLTLPISMENINDNNNATNNTLGCLGSVISREGLLQTNPTFRYIGTDGTFVLKRGAGTLQRVIVQDDSGTMLIYDNTVGSGTQIGNIQAAKSSLSSLEFGVPFSNGLTVVTAGTPNITLVYE